MFKPTRCNQKRKIFKDTLWQNVSRESAQVLFDRVNIDGNTDPTLNDYEYDQNGNMILDRNKGITEIKYNHLNLPTQITWANNKYISYQYNAAGQKVRKTVDNNDSLKIVDYLDGFQYAGNILQFFPTAEGYVKATRLDKSQTELSFNYIYNYTDHLGNVRLSYTLDPQAGKLRIVDEHHYYPFGLRHEVHYPSGNRLDFHLSTILNGGQVGDPVELVNVTETDYQYKYQGQERQDELGLNWDSFKWRNYDYAIGRFFNIDPLAEQYSYQSPYNFAENRVVDGRKLEGLEWTPSTSGNEVHCNVKVQVVNTAGLSDKKINKIAERIQKDFNKTYSQVDGYSASMTYDVVDVATSDYTIEVVDQIQKPVTITDADGNTQVSYVNGRTEKFGDTQDNNMKVSAKDSSGNIRSASGISKTTQHEIGHSAGLAHPWEKNAPVSSDIDQKTGDVKNGTIRKNLMNSDGNPNPALRNTSGTKLTPGQMETIDDTVNKNLGN